MSSLFDLIRGLVRSAIPGFLHTTVKFEDPENRINLPVFPMGKEGGRGYVCHRKDDKWFFTVMTHPQAVNLFEKALLLDLDDKKTHYPNVIINYKKAGVTINLIEEPHRIYSAALTEPHKGFYVSAGRTPWPDTQDCKDLYSDNLDTRYRAVLKYSPLTILFGGYGTHRNLSRPPKMPSLVEMEIIGESLGGDKPGIRRGTGGFMPKFGIGKDVVAPKNVKWSELGLATVPMNINTPEYQGAIALKDIRFDADLILGRLSDIRFGEESLDVRTYMIALWLHMFWLGYGPPGGGFSKFQGRQLLPTSVEFSLKLPPPYKCDSKLQTALKGLEPDICSKFYNEALDRVKGLVELEPLQLEASPQLDDAIRDSKESSKGRKNKEEGEEGEGDGGKFTTIRK